MATQPEGNEGGREVGSGVLREFKWLARDVTGKEGPQPNGKRWFSPISPSFALTDALPARRLVVQCGGTALRLTPACQARPSAAASLVYLLPALACPARPPRHRWTQINSILIVHCLGQPHADWSAHSEMMTIAGPADSAEPASKGKGSQSGRRHLRWRASGPSARRRSDQSATRRRPRTGVRPSNPGRPPGAAPLSATPRRGRNSPKTLLDGVDSCGWLAWLARLRGRRALCVRGCGEDGRMLLAYGPSVLDTAAASGESRLSGRRDGIGALKSAHMT